MIETFRATHCGQSYRGRLGAEELRAHMLQAHGERPLVPGGPRQQGSVRTPGAAGWLRGEIQAPVPWVAPRPSARGLTRVMERINSGDYGAETVLAVQAKAEVA